MQHVEFMRGVEPEDGAAARVAAALVAVELL
jgi:hypothetical protein